MSVKLTPVNHNAHRANDGKMMIVGGILLMIANGLPELGWSPVLYGCSAILFGVALLP